MYKGVLSSHSIIGSDGSMEREVAVKTMENNGASEEGRVKFLQEAAIMGQFNHPNIIKLLGVILNMDEKVWKLISIHILYLSTHTPVDMYLAIDLHYKHT